MAWAERWADAGPGGREGLVYRAVDGSGAGKGGSFREVPGVRPSKLCKGPFFSL